jgi:hypothetical protein
MDLLNILLGGGILAFIQWAVDKWSVWRGKKDKTMEAIEGLSKQIATLQHTVDEREAVLARTHILRFNDELYNGIQHSREYFDQTLEDIDTYEGFCEKNPEFKNSRTTMAVKSIRETYQQLHTEHKFL